MLRKFAVVVAVLATLSLSGCGYNTLQSQDEQGKGAGSEVVKQYQRRADLIPNLVNTVKGYAAHEKGVFEEVTAARAGVVKAAKDGSVAEKAAAEAALDRAVLNVMAVAENYPELKASANFLQLQSQLAETEGQLAFARQYYNDAVSQLNTSVSTIPWMFFAGPAGVSKKEFYEAPAGQQAPPTVQF